MRLGVVAAAAAAAAAAAVGVGPVPKEDVPAAERVIKAVRLVNFDFKTFENPVLQRFALHVQVDVQLADPCRAVHFSLSLLCSAITVGSPAFIGGALAAPLVTQDHPQIVSVASVP